MSSIRQSVCKVCGKPAGPGSAIVVDFGGGGRVHKGCHKAPPRPIKSPRK